MVNHSGVSLIEGHRPLIGGGIEDMTAHAHIVCILMLYGLRVVAVAAVPRVSVIVADGVADGFGPVIAIRGGVVVTGGNLSVLAIQTCGHAFVVGEAALTPVVLAAVVAGIHHHGICQDERALGIA